MTKPAATYCWGKTVVQIIDPAALEGQGMEKFLLEIQQISWEAWCSLSVQMQLQINAEHGKKK